MNQLRSWLRSAAVVAAVTVLAGGCVRSKVVVTSTPPGADVTMNDVHLGRTPVEMPFTWFWYYDFKAEKDGYASAIHRERFDAPVYLIPPLDLAMEMMPFPVRDTRRVHFELREKTEFANPEFVTE